MNRARRGWSLIPLLALLLAGGGCESQEANVEVEKLPEIKPNLPEVPKLPPDPHPVTYGDGSYSVFGLRKRLRDTIDSEVEVTAYVVETYEPPECPEGKTCPPARAPHVYVADVKDETDKDKRMLLVGYAENQKAIEEAIRDKKRGRYEPPPEDSGLLPVPTDLFPGAKIKVKAQFTRVSSSGFAQSDGLLDYRGHETLEPPPEQEPEG